MTEQMQIPGEGAAALVPARARAWQEYLVATRGAVGATYAALEPCAWRRLRAQLVEIAYGERKRAFASEWDTRAR